MYSFITKTNFGSIRLILSLSLLYYWYHFQQPNGIWEIYIFSLIFLKILWKGLAIFVKTVRILFYLFELLSISSVFIAFFVFILYYAIFQKLFLEDLCGSLVIIGHCRSFYLIFSCCVISTWIFFTKVIKGLIGILKV